MVTNVHWLFDLETGLKRARAEDKPVLLEFFSPGRLGCQELDAVTYSNTDVAEFLTNRMVLVQAPHRAEPIAAGYRVPWSSTILVRDHQGAEHQRTLSFLPPDQLIPSLLLGIAKADFNFERWTTALKHLDERVEQHPYSGVTPEALYPRGVSHYRLTRTLDASQRDGPNGLHPPSTLRRCRRRQAVQLCPEPCLPQSRSGTGRRQRSQPQDAPTGGRPSSPRVVRLANRLLRHR